MSQFTARLDACKKMLATYDKARDVAFRQGDSQIDWFSWTARLAGGLRSAVDLAEHGQTLLRDSRALNRQLLECIEQALDELGLSDRAAALRPALTQDPPKVTP